jgi:hypothetical protein
MNQEIAIDTNVRKFQLGQWLFNPFQFIAGGKALFIGVVIILITSGLGSISSTHFDGVLDVHTGRSVPIWLFIAEGLIDWLSFAVVLAIFGLILRGLSFRMIDILGTQALARWPHIMTAIVALAPGYQRYSAYISNKLLKTCPVATHYQTDALFFALVLVVVICMTIWMVVLMYRAYSVSCNIKGIKAVGSFIAGLIIAEVLSKLGIWWLFTV